MPDSEQSQRGSHPHPGFGPMNAGTRPETEADTGSGPGRFPAGRTGTDSAAIAAVATREDFEAPRARSASEESEEDLSGP